MLAERAAGVAADGAPPAALSYTDFWAAHGTVARIRMLGGYCGGVNHGCVTRDAGDTIIKAVDAQVAIFVSASAEKTVIERSEINTDVAAAVSAAMASVDGKIMAATEAVAPDAVSQAVARAVAEEMSSYKESWMRETESAVARAVAAMPPATVENGNVAAAADAEAMSQAVVSQAVASAVAAEMSSFKNSLAQETESAVERAVAARSAVMGAANELPVDSGTLKAIVDEAIAAAIERCVLAAERLAGPMTCAGVDTTLMTSAYKTLRWEQAAVW